MSTKQCSVCGQKLSIMTDKVNLTCDECGAPICDRCYSVLKATYVSTPTSKNIVGFIKLCPECQKRFNNSTTQQYIN